MIIARSTDVAESTTPKGASSSEPFWDTAASMLLMALMLYLVYEVPPEEQNFSDELNLPQMGEKKTALFAIIPDNDSSSNFLVSILYVQLFQQLFYVADN